MFGYSIREIINDGFKIDAIVNPGNIAGDGKTTAESIGRMIIGMTEALKKLKPDFLLILGDRGEPLAAAIAAAYMNIPVAHISGGDSAKAGLDEPARHSISKFASIHFPTTKLSAERLIKMGEDKWRVFVAGHATLDTVMNTKLPSKKDLEKQLGFKLKRPLILMVQHSVSTEPEKAGSQIRETLEAIKDLKLQTIIIYPNSDAGSLDIIKEIKKYEHYDFIHTFRNLSNMVYLGLLKNCDVIVGNSSSGIIETPAFKLPSVNIGIRQEGRERSTNVIDIVHKKSEIIKAIRKSIYDRNYIKKVKKCKNPYGDGKTSIRIANILSKIKIDKKLIQKKLTY